MEIVSAQLYVLLPILTAIGGFFFRNRQRILLVWFGGLSAVNVLLFLLWPSPLVGALDAPLCFTLVFSTLLVVLGRALTYKPAFDLFQVFILSGLGLGFMLNPEPLGHFFLIGVFAFLIRLQGDARHPLDTNLRWVIGLYGLGLFLIVAAYFFTGQIKAMVLIPVYAMLLPLFPFSGAYAVHLKHLPGVLPAFLALFLPLLGLRGLFPILAELPAGMYDLISICALVGMALASLRALVQIQISKLLTQGALVLWSILWWYLSGSGGTMTAAVVYSTASALTLCGLFLSWHGLKARYGDLLLEQFSGLAQGMPRFAFLFTLLIMATIGLPFFGVGAAFIEMAFSASLVFAWALLGVWFLLSWCFPVFMQKILFGPKKPDWIYVDFGKSEIAALSMIVIVLILLGVTPYWLFGFLNLPELGVQDLETVLWKR